MMTVMAMIMVVVLLSTRPGRAVDCDDDDKDNEAARTGPPHPGVGRHAAT